MGALALTDPINGNANDANLIANNNSAIKAVVNGGLDNSNINAAAAIGISKLAGYPTDSKKLLGGDGVWAARYISIVNNPAQDIKNDATENNLFSQTIVGGTLTSGKMLRYTVFGDYLNNSGASRTLTLRIKLGGTSMYVGSGVAVAATAARRGFLMQGQILGLTSSSQHLAGLVLITPTGASTGLGNAPATSNADASGYTSDGTIAVDMTADQAFVISIQHAVANASLELRHYGTIFEVIG